MRLDLGLGAFWAVARALYRCLFRLGLQVLRLLHDATVQFADR